MQEVRLAVFNKGVWLLCGVLALIYAMFALKELCVLLLIGFCIAYMLEPLVRRLESFKVSRNVSFFIISILAILVISLLFLSVIPTILRGFSELKVNFPEHLKSVDEVSERWSGFLSSQFGFPSGMAEQIDYLVDKLREHAPKLFSHVLPSVAAVLFKGYSMTLGLFNLFLLPFIVYYLVVDYKKLKQRFLYLFPRKKHDYILGMLNDIDTDVGAYLKGQLLVCTALFSLYAVALKLLGVELWFTIAFIAGYGNMIPYIGFVSGIFLATIMTLVTYGDFLHLLFTWGAFGGVQFLEGMFITPKIVGDSVGLSPLVIMLALVAGGSLFGLLGVCLAIPVTAILRVLGREYIAHVYDQAESLPVS